MLESQLEAVHKRLELFTHAMPSLVHLAVLVYGPSPASPQLWREVEVAAKARHVHVLPLYVSHSEDLEEAFQEAQHLGAQAVMTLYAPFFVRHTTKIVALTAQAKLPLAGGEPGLAATGAVLQVGPDYDGCAAGAAVFVACILEGAKASELPVERCRQMVVVFNRKAAHALGLTIDPTVTRGARVIE
jgi:putative tryptophan/tyrosine transport system substrate-binding protein